MILVTGGTGYIGSHTVVELLKRNYKIVLVDNFINSDSSVLEKIKTINPSPFNFEQIDICDYQALDAVLLKYPIDSVIHFAAFKSVGESVNDPLKYYKNNISGLVNLLECCLKHKIKNIVFSSSCTVYGEPSQMEIDETAAVSIPSSPYGNTKKIGEEIIRDFIKSSHFKALNLRYFNPIGSHDSGLIGDNPTGIPNNLIPYLTKVAKGELKELNVFGNDYPTKDGTCIRDYIHVSDVAKAHVNALDYFEKMDEGTCEDFNLGTGTGNSVLEVITTFEKSTGEKIPYKISPRRPGDITAIYANAQKAKLKLNWQAEYSLTDMLTSAWKFQQNN
jgi:UDP-glucose 4-epimerase